METWEPGQGVWSEPSAGCCWDGCGRCGGELDTGKEHTAPEKASLWWRQSTHLGLGLWIRAQHPYSVGPHNGSCGILAPRSESFLVHLEE